MKWGVRAQVVLHSDLFLVPKAVLRTRTGVYTLVYRDFMPTIKEDGEENET